MAGYKKVIPAFRQRLRTQLGKGTPVPRKTRGSKDCNPRAFQHSFGKLTKDKAVPWVDLIRGWMGRPGPTGTNLWNSQAACKRADAWLAERGRKPIRCYLKFSRKAVKQAIHDGRGVVLAIDYGQFNKNMGKTGDPNYEGGHAVYVMGENRWGSGTIVWLLYDSLDDERRPGIARGERWVPRWKVLKAAESWARRTNDTEVVAAVFRGGGAS